MKKEEVTQRKIAFSGAVRSVQPRSNVWRYRIDNRTHKMTGYNLFLTGTAEGIMKDFVVAISEKQQEKWHFRIGDEIKGEAWTKKDEKKEYADYYRAGSFRKTTEGTVQENTREPWLDEVPDLCTYDLRGCRMLDKRAWKGKCFACKWACMANVAIEYNFGVSRKYRFETFCYGPKNCRHYKMGKPRAVPYINKESSWDDGDLDDMCTWNRSDEE